MLDLSTQQPEESRRKKRNYKRSSDSNMQKANQALAFSVLPYRLKAKMSVSMLTEYSLKLLKNIVWEI
jgi:hypothetical protein